MSAIAIDVYEITILPFDGISDDTDSRILWVSIGALYNVYTILEQFESSEILIRKLPAVRHTDNGIDFKLPAESVDLIKQIQGEIDKIKNQSIESEESKIEWFTTDPPKGKPVLVRTKGTENYPLLCIKPQFKSDAAWFSIPTYTIGFLKGEETEWMYCPGVKY